MPVERDEIDDATLNRIADLAKIVGDERRSNYFRSLRAGINDAWGSPMPAPLPVYGRPVLDELEKWQSAIVTLREQLTPDANSRAAFHALMLIRLSLTRQKRENLYDFEETWSSALNDMNGAIAKATEDARKIPLRGRPAGTRGNVAVNSFAYWLFFSAIGCGGRLTFSRLGGAGHGTLIEALELLRPSLPPTFLSSALSVKVIEHVRRRVEVEFGESPDDN